MEKFKVLAMSATLLAALFTGAPAARGAVDTIYLGENPSVSGGSCTDPDFSTAGGYDAAMASALAAIDADGDTIVMCNGSYTVGTTNEVEVDYSFTIRAETRRAVTISGSDSILRVCAPEVTIRGLRIVELGTVVFEPECEVTLNLYDVEIADGRGIAYSFGGEGFLPGAGTLRIVSSHIHGNSDLALALAGSIFIVNSIIEGNFSLLGLIAPERLSIERSRLNNNSAFLAAIGLTSCLTVDKSTFTDNGGAVGEVPGAFGMLYSFNFLGEEGEGCAAQVRNSHFEGNESYAGALTLIDPLAGTTVRGNTFIDNLGVLAGAVAVCSTEGPSRQLEAMAKRIGFFKLNRFRGNAAEDRRAHNTAFTTENCADIG